MLTKSRDEHIELQKAIDKALFELQEYSVDHENYPKMLDNIKALHKLKEQKSSTRVSPDTLAIVLGNLAGIMLIIGHERAHVVTSKALGFVMKAK